MANQIMSKLNYFIRKGYILLAVLALASCSESTEWTIVRVPIELNKGNSISHTFKSNRTFKFQIQIEVKRDENDIKKTEKYLTDEIDISWIIQSGNKPVANGRASGPMRHLIWSGKTASRVLGDFEGIEGKEYSLFLKVNENSPNLSKVEPQILIEPDAELYKSGMPYEPAI